MINMSGQLALAVLLQKGAAQSGALENGLDKMVLLQRLGQVLVHLRLNAALAITHHGVSRQSNNGGSLCAEAALVLADLARGLKSTLEMSR